MILHFPEPCYSGDADQVLSRARGSGLALCATSDEEMRMSNALPWARSCLCSCVEARPCVLASEHCSYSARAFGLTVCTYIHEVEACDGRTVHIRVCHLHRSIASTPKSISMIRKKGIDGNEWFIRLIALSTLVVVLRCSINSKRRRITGRIIVGKSSQSRQKKINREQCW